MHPESQHIGDAIALITFEIIATAFPDSEIACAKLDLLGGRLLDTVRGLDPGPMHDIVNAAAQVLVMSEI